MKSVLNRLNSGVPAHGFLAILLAIPGSLAAGDAPAGGASGEIQELLAPREIACGQDVTFAATVDGQSGGSIQFELKTYANKTVWSGAAAIEEGRAVVTMDSGEAATLEKGNRVLKATVAGLDGKPAYAAVRLRGRVFRNPEATPAGIQPGDEIVITDLSTLQPETAVREVSEKGTWWRRAYRISDEAERRHLVCVEQRDLDDPQSCLAGQLRLPLNVTGWYEVWVRTYRHHLGGGIDVRLSGEKYFMHANPLQIEPEAAADRHPYGALVDIRYRAADLSGQDLVFQQPYGTYDSEHKLANASLAGVRLVKLSQSRVDQLRAERSSRDVKRIGYDNDGFSYFWRVGVHDKSCIARLLEPLRDQSASFLNISLGGLGGIIIPTPYTGMYQMTGHDRDGDLRANAFFRWCFEHDVNIVDVLAERAHEVGLKLFVSLMAERSFSRDKTMRAHPQWRIQRGRGTWYLGLCALGRARLSGAEDRLDL